LNKLIHITYNQSWFVQIILFGVVDFTSHTQNHPEDRFIRLPLIKLADSAPFPAPAGFRAEEAGSMNESGSAGT
jgi:hypothetical protein